MGVLLFLLGVLFIYCCITKDTWRKDEWDREQKGIYPGSPIRYGSKGEEYWRATGQRVFTQRSGYENIVYDYATQKEIARIPVKDWDNYYPDEKNGKKKEEKKEENHLIVHKIGDEEFIFDHSPYDRLPSVSDIGFAKYTSLNKKVEKEWEELNKDVIERANAKRRELRLIEEQLEKEKEEKWQAELKEKIVEKEEKKKLEGEKRKEIEEKKMSKGILVIDMPKNCGECKFCHTDGDNRTCLVCDKKAMVNYTNSFRPKWCPFKNFPEKKDDSVEAVTVEQVQEKMMNIGFNKCRDYFAEE